MLLIEREPVNQRAARPQRPAAAWASFLAAGAAIAISSSVVFGARDYPRRGRKRHGLLSVQSLDGGGKARSPEIVAST
jgi:hypothetical protein